MSKKTNKKPQPNQVKKDRAARILQNQRDYAFSMGYAPSIDESSSWLHMVPIAFFAAVVILIVIIHPYARPMSQFYWTGDLDTTYISDFFSYGKMVGIIVSACIALLMGLYRLTTQSLTIKRSFAYIPMGIYSILIILSYAFSDYKDFALLGWNDRFEGTIPLLCYMIVLFLIINSVNTEKNVKQVIWPIAISSTILSILGISQATDHDFFKTTLGQKLLCLDFRNLESLINIDQAAAKGEYYLQFTFNNREIYQTVYNINYVSFYLTLLVPIFCMLFIRALQKGSEEKLWKKIALGALIALLIFNLIGSQSSGGYLGIGVALIIALIIFNKRLIKWWKPLLCILLILAVVMGFTFNRWWPELSGAIKSVLNIETEAPQQEEEKEESNEPGSAKCTIDYMETVGKEIRFSVNGNEIRLACDIDETNTLNGFSITDADGKPLEYFAEEETGRLIITDERFNKYLTLGYGYEGNLNFYFIQVVLSDTSFAFVAENGEMKMYIPATQKTTSVSKIDHWGFENNQGFGSGRGYIWSRAIPMLKQSLIIGKGADTFCAYFPHNDYAGKYNAYGASNILLIVDKPHNMYIHMGFGTGLLSLIVMLGFFFVYFLQSLKVYCRRDYGNDFLSYAGVGAFLGVCGFLVAGFVDDSTVSVMPLFYTMLGLGLAINMIIQRREGTDGGWKPWAKKDKKQNSIAGN